MDKLSETIKIRCTTKDRHLLQTEADSRGLKFADIIRQAIREYVFAHKLIPHEVTK